jgi:hypothetical protein
MFSNIATEQSGVWSVLMSTGTYRLFIIFRVFLTLRVHKIIVIGAAGVALAAGGVLPSFVFAATDSRTSSSSTAHRRFGFEHVGTVSSVNGSSITLAARNGVTYTVDAENAKIVKGGSTTSLSAIVVGDPIAVIGPTQSTTIDAKAIFDGPHATSEHHGTIVGGTIATISSGELTLIPKTHLNRRARPDITVTINADTVVTKAGQVVTLNSLIAGTNIIVSGTRESSTTLTATKIIIRKG